MTRLPVLPAFEPGTVWLAGAGPGDPGLMTLAAHHGLGQADVVVHDALVDGRILALARPGALIEDAGKRGHRPSPHQDAISASLIAHAKAGRRVLRLKGGDPFVFGRGYEEALALAAAGIRFRVVPGVSSGLAALALHGVPATARGANHAVVLATGHLAAGEESPDWTALARTGQPILLYMAVAKIEAIAAALMAGGLGPETPALVVHAAATGAETVLPATLGSLGALAEAGRIRSPAVVAIGQVAALREAIAGHLIEGDGP